MNKPVTILYIILITFGLFGCSSNVFNYEKDIPGDGPLPEYMLEYNNFIKQGVNGIDGLGNASDIVVSPDGKNLYIVSSDNDSLTTFLRNEADGTLYFGSVLTDGVNGVDGLDAASSLAISPDGKNVYVPSADDNSVVTGGLAIFNRNTDSGELTYVDVLRDGVNGVDGLDQAFKAVVSADGKNVYVISAPAGLDNLLVVFERNIDDGTLAFQAIISNGNNGVTGLSTISSLAVSSPGQNLYALGSTEDSLALFSRNTINGSLTFGSSYQDGTDGIIGLSGGTDLVISPDDNNVYVSTYEDSLLVFNRNSLDGTLTYLEHFIDEGYGYNGLDGANSVVVSPDGYSVYVASENDNALAVFKRNPDTGRLTYDTYFQEGYNANELAGARDVIISPDGKNVYVYSAIDMSIVNFKRSLRE